MTKRRRKLTPELDLPELVLDVLTQYVGPRRLGKLDARQRRELSRVTQEVGFAVGRILAGVLPADGPPVPTVLERTIPDEEISP